MEISHLKSKSFDLKSAPFNIEALLNGLDTFGKQIIRDPVRFECERVDDKGTSWNDLEVNIATHSTTDTPVTIEQVIGDDVRLHQVISHLICNASQFTIGGCVTLRCTQTIDPRCADRMCG